MAPQALFLSHAGAEADAARALKERLLASPDAQAAGLDVWLDLDDLEEGLPWRDQIEAAIARSTAFAVLLGSKGAQNWVKAETDLALSRAVKEEGFRFIPILIDNARSKDVSPFVRRYHAIRDPLRDENALMRLLRAALAQDTEAGAPILTDQPFIGLRAMDETWSDRFFGRDKEVAFLLNALQSWSATAILAESGAGKSSLALAGLAPAWRGGALREERPHEGAPEFWHVISMRPRSNPLQGLKDAVTTAAQTLGREETAQFGYRKRLSLNDPSESLYALECGLPPEQTRTLLIIDQAEELITQSGGSKAPHVQAFGRFLQEIARLGEADARLRIVFTARREHFNVLSEIEGLSDLLDASKSAPHLHLGLPGPAEIDALIRRPLAMAGWRNESEQDQLIHRIQNDLADRPGDLALVQMALRLVWRDRDKHGGLLGAYTAAGGVLKALGGEAERVERSFTEAERSLLLPVFARLVRLGEAVGATRRSEPLENFDQAKRDLVDKLASENGGRLLQIGETTVEIAHEALIFQWPALSRWVFDPPIAQDMRLLDRLMERAQSGVPAIDQDLKQFQALAKRRHDWMSQTEYAFLRRSVRRAWLTRLLASLTTMSITLLMSIALSISYLVIKDGDTFFTYAYEIDSCDECNYIYCSNCSIIQNEHDHLQRRHEQALQAYKESLQIFRALSDLDLNNAGWRRNVSVSLNKLGDLYHREGQHAQALQSYEESLQITRALSDLDPDTIEWRTDLVVSLFKISQVTDHAEACRDALDEAILIIHSLAAAQGALSAEQQNWPQELRAAREACSDEEPQGETEEARP